MNDMTVGSVPPANVGAKPAASKRMSWKVVAVIMLVLAFAGAALGLVQGVWQANAPFSLLPESERPQRLEAMRSAVAAFYRDPTDARQMAAKQAIIDYRRTFGDALPDTLQAGSEKIDCGQSAECQMLRTRKDNEHIALAGVIVNKYPSLSVASTDYHTRVALDFALERRITAAVALAYIDQDRKHFNGERELAGLRERFFVDIDKAVRNEGVTERDLVEYLRVYRQAAENTFKPIKPGRHCPQIQKGIEDGRQCARSTSEVEAAYRLPDRQAKVAVAKKAIAERDAPVEVLQNSISQIFR